MRCAWCSTMPTLRSRSIALAKSPPHPQRCADKAEAAICLEFRVYCHLYCVRPLELISDRQVQGVQYKQSDGWNGSSASVQVTRKRAWAWCQTAQGSSRAAVPPKAGTQASVGPYSQQPLRGAQHAYAWQHPPTAFAAILPLATVSRRTAMSLSRPRSPTFAVSRNYEALASKAAKE